jgi:sugar phosphate isomerase/epimerase
MKVSNITLVKKGGSVPRGFLTYQNTAATLQYSGGRFLVHGSKRMTFMRRRTFLGSLAGAAGVPAAAADRSWPIGANTAITGWGLLEAIGLLRGIGFDTIEIHPMGTPEATPGKFPGFQFDALSSQQKQAIRSALRGFRLVTTHLPYTGLDYFAADDAVAEAAVKVVDIALEGSAYFGARIAVLHPKPGTGQTPASEWPAMLKRIRRWGDMARRHRMRIALETGYPASVKDFVRLVRELDHPAVGATIDVGHQSRYAELITKVKPEDRATPQGIRAYNDTTLAIVEALGPKVIHFHVHDIDPATWKEHLPLGTGFVDYPRLFRQLDEIGYRGALVLEIGGPAEQMKGHLEDGKRRIEEFRRGSR